tara:strand:+ start:5316 stop:5891 length:576 start_codon:yes stop_codon:yes gene_type:complete
MKIAIVDNAIPASIALSAAVDFPDLSWDGWHFYDDVNACKRGMKDGADFPSPSLAVCLREMAMACGNHIRGGCFADFSLFGAGLHRMDEGGFLKPHLDASMHRLKGWRREYSATLFLSPSWSVGAGGELSFTDQLILPVFNRLVLFRCTDQAFHEVKKVASAEPRLSLALFFYSLREPSDITRTKAKFDYE